MPHHNREIYMRPAQAIALICILGTLCCCAFVLSAAADDGWIPLFNGKNFDGWYSFLRTNGKNHDPNGVFKVENGAVHILDVPEGKGEDGYLSTIQDYSDVRIHTEFKWGTKRNSEGKRNSGFLYLANGPDFIYPLSLECQIEETDVGDLWIVNGASVTAFFVAPGFPMYDDDRNTGTRVSSVPGVSLRVLKSGDFEDRTGWNTVDVILDGNTSQHLVNGRIVNSARDIERPDPRDPTRMIPLKSGRILLEAEGAEIWFRDIRIKPLHPASK